MHRSWLTFVNVCQPALVARTDARDPQVQAANKRQKVRTRRTQFRVDPAVDTFRLHLVHLQRLTAKLQPEECG